MSGDEITMSSDLAIALIGSLITIIGTLMVILLGWLHVRLNRMEASSIEAKRELYRHLDDNYMRRDVYASDMKSLQSSVDGMRGQVDSIFKMLTQLALTSTPSGDGQ